MSLEEMYDALANGDKKTRKFLESYPIVNSYLDFSTLDRLNVYGRDILKFFNICNKNINHMRICLFFLNNSDITSDEVLENLRASKPVPFLEDDNFPDTKEAEIIHTIDGRNSVTYLPNWLELFNVSCKKRTESFRNRSAKIHGLD